MYLFDESDLDFNEIFSKHSILIFNSTNASKEQTEIINILNDISFKNLYIIDNLSNALSLLNKKNISIVFFGIDNIKNIQAVRDSINDNETKIFLSVDNITNYLFTLRPDEFIFNPNPQKKISILKLIYKNLILIENSFKHKSNELKITEQQKNFDKIFELLSNNSLITKTDISGKIIYANDIFKKTSGYKKNEILGHKHSIIRHEKTSDAEIKSIWETISKKKIWSGILRNRTKNGHDYIVETKIIPELDINGEINSFLSVQYDITDLVHKNELAKLLLDEQSNPILIGQVGKGIINASNEFLNDFGFIDLKFFENEKNSLLNLALNLENQDEIKLELFRNNATVTLKNLRLITNYETIKIFDVLQKRITTPFGNYFLITLIDITISQKEVDDAKNEAIVKSNFLATMSHEIRTPLNGMIPYIDLLLENRNYTKEQLEYLEIIKQSSEGLLRIINDILDFSKIESGKLEIENISFNPVHEFETIIDLYVAKANEKKINLYTFIDPTLPYLIGDPLRIKQIINNLLSNAIKFTPDFGEIIFSVENNSNQEDYADLCITIKDNGKGISEEHQKFIFNSFSQADNSISRKFGGTGLGLSISSDLAKIMGGTITLKSQIDHGCKFSLNLRLLIDKQTKNNKYYNDEAHLIGIYTLNKNLHRCEIVLLLKYLKSMKFKYKKISTLRETEQCDVIFVISSGDDSIPFFTEEFTKITKVITIIGSTVENRNRFHSNAIIQMPINGSKIFDAIVDIKRLHKQNEYLLRYSSHNIDKYNAKVLVAEDNSTNQKLVKTLLSKHGIKVEIAGNGKIALEKYIYEITDNTSNYDLIFLDIHMPIMDGLEAIKNIREYEFLNNIRPIYIIALTADAIKTHQSLYLEIGFDDFLAKPIEKLKFEQILKQYLFTNLITYPNEPKESDDCDSFKNFPKVQDEHKMLSKDKINMICQNLGLERDIAIVLLEEFMINWADFQQALTYSISKLDYDKIREIAHSLKGAAGSLMLNEIFNITKILENIAINKEIDSINLFDELFEKLKNEIEK